MNATEGTEGKTSTNDHIVPRMYLRRFAIDRSGGPQVRAASVEAPEKDFIVNTRNVGAEKSFYWGSGPDGVPTHDMEAFLTDIETVALTATGAAFLKDRVGILQSPMRIIVGPRPIWDNGVDSPRHRP